jgi:hypothetical protein
MILLTKDFFIMRNKEKLYEWIDRFNNNDLQGEEYDQLLTMMNMDLRVREEILLDKDLNSILKEKDILDLRTKINKVCTDGVSNGFRDKRILLVAATLLIILTMGYSVYYLSRLMKSPESRKFEYSQSNSENSNWNITFFPFQNQQKVKNFFDEHYQNPFNHSGNNGISKELLACYQPNKKLEYLVGVPYRSVAFSLKSPTHLYKFNLCETVLFSWRIENPAKTRLTIIDNRGELRYESEYNHYQTVQIKARFLGPGLFYYKIICKDEVICFDKFSIQ